MSFVTCSQMLPHFSGLRSLDDLVSRGVNALRGWQSRTNSDPLRATQRLSLAEHQRYELISSPRGGLFAAGGDEPKYDMPGPDENDSERDPRGSELPWSPHSGQPRRSGLSNMRRNCRHVVCRHAFATAGD
jgi:hypothetical protein